MGSDDERSGTTAESRPSSTMRASVDVRQLVLVREGRRERSVRLTLDDRGVVVGREPSGEVILTLDDAEVSRQHTRVLPDGTGGWLAADCGSRNGTIVDGVCVTGGVPLKNGSVVRIGSSLLIFVAAALPSHVRLEAESGAMLGSSLGMQQLRGELAAVARQKTPVLILGESGTGKELTALRLHEASGRAGPFVTVNCAAIPSALAETELFGHIAGAFTGAIARAQGLFGAAHDGTLFLDEIGELDPAVQAKLLRVLATGEVRAVGTTDSERVDVRVVAATHRDLQGGGGPPFRGDLYARLSSCVLRTPPLRSRRDDIVRIATAFLAREFRGVELSAGAAEAIALFDWPFNVRQLENVLRSAAVSTHASIGLEHLPEEVAAKVRARTPASGAAELPLEVIVARNATPNRAQLEAVLRRFEGSISLVADYFGKDRKQIYRWLERHSIPPPHNRR